MLQATITPMKIVNLRIPSDGARIARSLLPAGLTAIQLSDRVRTEADAQRRREIEFEVSNRRAGVLESNSGKTRTLVEFDPQNSIARRIDPHPKARSDFFGNPYYSFRRD